jgi:hypothetical protein
MCLADLGFEEWSTITTIILSVVAIVVAICSSRSTLKGAETQIVEMEKQIGERHKQVCEIKNLSALQIDTTIKLVEVEIQKTIAKVKLSAMESEAMDRINHPGMSHQVDFRNAMMREHQEMKPLRELQIYSECSQNLKELLENLNQLKKK